MSRTTNSCLRLLLVFCFSATLAACPENKPAGSTKAAKASDQGVGQNQGGYDWGGGEALKSSPDLVERTIELAQAFAGEEKVEKNLFRKFLIWHLTTSSGTEKLNTSLVFPNSGAGLISDHRKLTYSPALEAISKKNINLLDTGDCPHSGKEATADASVSKHTLDGDVCFSIGNLAKISPSDLIRQIMGLMLHEASHLAGADENYAKQLQESFNVFFGMQYGEMIGEVFLAKNAPEMHGILLNFAQTRDQIGRQMPIPHIYAVYGKTHATLSRLSGIDDRLGIRLRLSLSKDIAVDKFVGGVENLKDYLERIGKNKAYFREHRNATFEKTNKNNFPVKSRKLSTILKFYMVVPIVPQICRGGTIEALVPERCEEKIKSDHNKIEDPPPQYCPLGRS